MTYRRKKKKRVRKVETIEAEINAHEERYRKHLLWKDRNERFSERRKYYCAAIEEQISQLRDSEGSYRKMLGLLRTRELTAKAAQELSKLEMQLSEAEKKALIDVPMLDFPYEQHPNTRCMYSDWKMIPVYLQRELAQAKEKESKKEKQRAIKARVAKADEKTRVLAASVKLRLPQDHLYPYCGKDLGDSPHADHIYPVSRGGLSTSVNMVYVCTDCNAKKRDKTLRMFIEEFELDRIRIEERLSELGKEF